MESKFSQQLRLKAGLRNLLAKRCWECAGGPTTGSRVSLHFGKKMPFLAPPNLPGKIPEYEGEFIIFVEGATWRLDDQRRVICGSEDSKWPLNEMMTNLRRLVGTTVSAVKLQNPVHDLTIEFSKRFVLRVFCSQTNEQNALNNYSIHLPSGAFIIGPRSVLSHEK